MLSAAAHICITSVMEIWRGNLNYGLCVLVIKSSNENVKQYDLISWLFECSMGSGVYLTKCAGRMFGIRDLHPSRNGYWTLFYIFSLFCFLWWSLLISIPFAVTSTQSARESSEVQDELSEKVDRLKAELVVFKSLMSDVSVCSVMSPSPPWAAQSFSHTRQECHVDSHTFIMLAVFEACMHRCFLIRAAIHTGLHTHTQTHTHTHPLLLTSFSSTIEKYIMPESLPRQAFIEKSSNSSCRSGVLPVLCSSVLFPGSSAPVWYTAVIYCSGLSHSLCLLRDKYSQDVVFLFIVLILTFWCLPHCRFSCCFLCLTSSPMMCESRDRYVWDVWVVDLLRHVDWLISQFRSCG